MDRRDALKVATALSFIALLPVTARATPEAMTAAVEKALGGTIAKPGRIKLEVSPLAENGNSVPVTLTVESPMTAADHVKTIYMFAPENPQPLPAWDGKTLITRKGETTRISGAEVKLSSD